MVLLVQGVRCVLVINLSGTGAVGCDVGEDICGTPNAVDSELPRLIGLATRLEAALSQAARWLDAYEPSD